MFRLAAGAEHQDGVAEISVPDMNMGGVLTGDVKKDLVQLHLSSPPVDEALDAALDEVLEAALSSLLDGQQQVHMCVPWFNVFSKSSSCPIKLKLGEMFGLQRLT